MHILQNCAFDFPVDFFHQPGQAALCAMYDAPAHFFRRIPGALPAAGKIFKVLFVDILFPFIPFIAGAQKLLRNLRRHIQIDGDIRPGQGTYISGNEANFFVIPLSWSLFMNGNQTESILEVRDLLEVKAAYLAADCVDDRALNRLYDVSHKIHQAYVEQNYKKFLDADLEFHSSIAECSGNTVIYSMLQTISNLMRHVSETGMIDGRQLQEIYEEHQKIYGLILAKDGEGAAEAMEEHMKRSKVRYNYR